MVAMVHVGQALPPEQRTGLAFKTYSIVFNGHAALTMFFVLSGFVLFLSLDRGPQRIPLALSRFSIARTLRIYMPIIGNIALFYLLFRFFGAALPGVSDAAYAPISLLRNALLIDTSINGVMWSLQLEILAIPLIFLGYFLLVVFVPWPLLVLLNLFLS